MSAEPEQISEIDAAVEKARSGVQDLEHEAADDRAFRLASFFSEEFVRNRMCPGPGPGEYYVVSDYDDQLAFDVLHHLIYSDRADAKEADDLTVRVRLKDGSTPLVIWAFVRDAMTERRRASRRTVVERINDMADYQRDATHPVARKEHRCIFCGGPILRGEQYVQQEGFYDGSPYRNRYHSECYDDCVEIGRRWGECEFTPYQHEPPERIRVIEDERREAAEKAKNTQTQT